MTDLTEGQWELDGFLFGEYTDWPVLLNGLDYGSGEVRTQDTNRSTADGQMMGRDYVNGPTYSFTIGILDDEDVWDKVAQLNAAWRADAVRATPGALSVLRFMRAGRVYRVYGRPRDFGLMPSERWDNTLQKVTCTFQLSAPEQQIEPEGSTSRSLTLNLIQGDSGGGWVWPVTWPVDLRQSTQARTGEVTVGGVRPSPFRVEVHGPESGYLSGIKLSGNGWEIETSATVAYDQVLVIDTRAMTITLGGHSIGGTLTRKSRLSTRLNPGHQLLTFDGVDPTNTAYAVITWCDTVPA